MRRPFKWDKKYLYWGGTAFCVIACAILFYMALNYLPALGRAGLCGAERAKAFEPSSVDRTSTRQKIRFMAIFIFMASSGRFVIRQIVVLEAMNYKMVI